MFFSKFRRSKRGVGSVVGAVFVILIILSGFVFYQIALLTMNNYNRVTDEMNQADWRRANEELTILGAHVTSSNYLDVTVKNTGSVQSVIEWIGIFDQSISPEGQQFFSANIPIPIGENRTFNSGQEGIFNATFMITPTNHEYLVQLVTKEGNIYFFTLYPASQADLALSLIAVPATVYQGNNITVFATVTNINEYNVVANNLVLDLTVDPTDWTQEVSAPDNLTIDSLSPGSSTFFTWTYTTTTGATEDKTVTFTATLNPDGPSASASVTIKPQPNGSNGQGQITITGSAATQKYSPSQWSTLGETTHLSGTITDLSASDNNKVSFESYYTGTEDTINKYVTSNNSNVDGIENIGFMNNFEGMQSEPNGNYAVLTENLTVNSAHIFGNNITGTSSDEIKGGEILGCIFNSGSATTAVSSIKFYGTSNSHNVHAKAVICNNSGNILINGTSEESGRIDKIGWHTLTFKNPPSVNPNTTYFLMIISESSKIYVYYSNSVEDVGIRENDNNYDSPTNLSGWDTNNFNYSIYATTTGAEGYNLDYEVQWTDLSTSPENSELSIYLTEQSGSENSTVDVRTPSGWFNAFPSLTTGWNNISITPYLTSSTFTIRFRDATPNDATMDSWNIETTLIRQTGQIDQYTCEVEFSGTSDTEVWQSILWNVETSFDANDVVVTIQFYDYNQNAYVTSGDGYSSFLSIAEQSNLQSQTVESNFDRFRDSSGTWKVKIVATKYISDQFTMNVDWIELQTTYKSDGNTVAYGEFQEYTIKATSATGVSAAFMYASIYVNGTNIALLNADTNQAIANPAWVQLDVNGEYRIKLQSTNSESETFVILVSVGTTVGQKTVTQEAP